MTTPAVSSDAVRERVNAMRISAEQSLSRVRTFATSDPQPLAKIVAAYRALVATTGRRLVQAHAAVIQVRVKDPHNAALIALERRIVGLLVAWSAHAQGYTQYERPATTAEKGGSVEVGVAPGVIVIALAAAGAVIAVSFTGIAWAVVHYKEAETLQQEIALIERDPSLAQALARINETAPRSDSPLGLPTGGGWGWLVAALGIAGAALFIVPKLGKG